MNSNIGAGTDMASWNLAWVAAREELAQWMMANGFSTGHGEHFKDLLGELQREVDELREGGR